MANETLKFVLLGEDKSASKTLAAVGDKAEDAGKRVDAAFRSLDRTGSIMALAGAALLGGGAVVAKEAMAWESQFAGVEKTVDGTAAQIRGLEGDLRGMARTMAASHEEIAATAEAAGQLGVATEDVADFTRVMVMLGETTNLTADEAATNMAQFMNIMGTSSDKVGQLGATLVDLGNKGASTEAQILELGQRLAGAANQVGINEQATLAYGNALASLGINAEAGGTAMSKVFLKLRDHVDDAGEGLQVLNEVTGVDFAKAFKTDAAGAVDMLVRGLGEMQGKGENVANVLADLGMKGQYERDVMMRLAGATIAAGGSQDLLTESLKNADQAMRDSANGGGALMDEYAKRAATTESKVTVAWNNIKDAAITAGSGMLPAIAGAADGLSGVLQVAQQIPAPVQQAAVGLAAIGGAGLVAVGGTMKAASAFRDLKGDLELVKEQFPKLSKAAGAVPWGKLAVGAAAVAAGYTIASAAIGAWNDHATRSLEPTERVATAVENLGRAGSGLHVLDTQVAGLGAALQTLGHQNVGDLGGMFRELGDEARAGARWFNEATDGFLGQRNKFGLIRDEVGKLDSALAGMVTGGNLSGAQVAFTKISDASLAAGESLEFTADQMPQYRAALQDTAAALDVTTLSTEDYARWMRGEVPTAIREAVSGGGALVSNLTEQQAAMVTVTSEAERQAAALREMSEAQGKAAQGAAGLSGAQNAMEDALDKTTEAIKKNGATYDRNTEQGRANWAVVDQIASSTGKYVEQLAKAGAPQAELDAAMTRGRESMVKMLEAMGYLPEKAREIADGYDLIPNEVTTLFNTPGAAVSKQQAADMEAAVKKIPRLAETSILAPGARPSKAEVDAFVKSVGTVPGLTEAEIRTIADLYGVEQAKRAIAGVQGKTVQVTVNYRAAGVSNVRIASAQADGGMLVQSNIGLTQAFASGGFYAGSIGSRSPGLYPYAGPGGVTMNEAGSGPWESIISGHPAKQGRSRMITEETARRLGGFVVWGTPYADGGVMERIPTGSSVGAIAIDAGGRGPVELGPRTIGALIDGFRAGASGAVASNNRAQSLARRWT